MDFLKKISGNFFYSSTEQPTVNPQCSPELEQKCEKKEEKLTNVSVVSDTSTKTNENSNTTINMGQINHGYVGSSKNLDTTCNTARVPPCNVYREQYWSCTFFKTWTKRERILFLVIAILFCIIFGLVTVVGILADKDIDSEKRPNWWQKI